MTPYDEQCVRKATRDGVLDAVELVLRALSMSVAESAAKGDAEAMQDVYEIDGFRAKLHDVRNRPGVSGA